MSERIQINNESLPRGLKEFWTRARTNTYAGDATPIPGISSPGSSGFHYDEENCPYIYVDEYHTHAKSPGNFIGTEMVRKYRFDGPRVALYTYAGGLTKNGLTLGEETIYGILKKVLREKAEIVRFGNRIMTEIENQDGHWQYEGYGSLKPWGWDDKERITLNHVLVYELSGAGVSFVS